MLGPISYQFEGNAVDREKITATVEQLEAAALRWINAPYLWGGRTIFGVDCSGFVQMNFKMMGIDLPRDAWQQAQRGENVKKLRLAEKGDLAFFDDNEEIVHVGMLLDPTRIIHASGRVRIDTIDKKGIIHSETGKRTHQLRAIRRIF
jgi:cell wall-associated NlpC family hydrolase